MAIKLKEPEVAATTAASPVQEEVAVVKVRRPIGELLGLAAIVVFIGGLFSKRASARAAQVQEELQTPPASEGQFADLRQRPVVDWAVANQFGSIQQTVDLKAMAVNRTKVDPDLEARVLKMLAEKFGSAEEFLNLDIASRQ